MPQPPTNAFKGIVSISIFILQRGHYRRCAEANGRDQSVLSAATNSGGGGAPEGSALLTACLSGYIVLHSAFLKVISLSTGRESQDYKKPGSAPFPASLLPPGNSSGMKALPFPGEHVEGRTARFWQSVPKLQPR